MFEKLTLTFPFKNVIASYSKTFIGRDVVAGLTVAAVAVPQSIAYAQLAGVTIAAGLYAALVSMVIFAIFTATKRVIMGPDAALAALSGAAVLPLVAGDGVKAMTLVAILAVLVGLMCMVSVLFRLSIIAEFISRPILLGYMAGLALIVTISQIPKLFGIEIGQYVNALAMLRDIGSSLWQTNVATLIIGLTALSIGLIASKTFKRAPISLLLLVVATICSWLFSFSAYGIATVGTVSMNLTLPNLSAIKPGDIQALIIPAIAMMVIAYANTIATARTFAIKGRERVRPEQELFGLGLSNMVTGLFSGMPVSASGVRTSINTQSKAYSQVAQIIAAVGIGIVIVALLPLLQYLPLCVLAVIVILAVAKLFNLTELRSIWHAWRSEAILAVVTMLGVALLGIYQGLLLAVLLAVMNILRKSAFPNDAVLGVTATGSVRDMHRPPKTTEIPGIKMYRFDAPLYFGNANYFRNRVLQLVKESKEPVHWFLWDAETITAIDSTSGAMLVELIAELKAQHVVFAVARMKGSIRDIVHHTHTLNRVLQHTPHYPSLGEAIEAFKAKQNNPL